MDESLVEVEVSARWNAEERVGGDGGWMSGNSKIWFLGQVIGREAAQRMIQRGEVETWMDEQYSYQYCWYCSSDRSWGN